MAWLRLIRWQNLLIIFFTQFIAWRFVVLPEQEGPVNTREFFSGATNFFLVSLSTVFIAAAGYIINDYFDIRIDEINHPEKVVLGKIIPGRLAIVLHMALNISGLFLAAIVASKARHYEWLLLQVTCITLLWFYSTDFKRQYLTGNLVVSLLAALTVIALLIYEPALQPVSSTLFPNGLSGYGLSPVQVWVLVIYAYFAFMLTWIREIVKDMEDLKGDEEEGCMTMPIKFGLQFSNRFIQVLSALVVLPLSLASMVLLKHHFIILSLYLLVLLIAPIIAWALFLVRNFTGPHYHRASSFLKIIMLLGIFSLFIYHFQFSINSVR